MAEPFVGEIRVFAGSFAPVGWELCNGQLLSIAQNDALFALIGTTYGGDGITTFGLPDLAGRIPVHRGVLPGGGTYELGATGGAERVALTQNQLPQHTHVPNATATPDTTSPAGAVWSTQTTGAYQPADPGTPMGAQAVQPAGGSLPHENMPPSLAITYIIAVQGIFPPRG
ncbi:tail fiber protein [Agromyces mediolanus]|uniref:phage tail protein n=1 Tax=Agromyces mediolanus TaxID=41986 RepID=UPI00203FAF2A|nr:tail fiber protein [Agromyces mediolanus]MCM3657525.1 tail fiber protein [Agromyces mediolanus]